ncbi:response regulator [Konateibacter massiliensis]|uniref:response regulator n=1 Tax=Konateibacter massiliensis TaxID=2002841 RepID=UPI000C1535A0|nr:response regulator [Konateibacter massiliensis]
MKLLIVDDEELTREGLIHSIDWESLGIHAVYEADDGLHGLELAKKHCPEIILSDVRMPRMDGVEMAKQLRDLLPGCSIIFMSGYSDKAYLKAAIKLKAISYVEKPIDPAEIKDSVREAVHNQKSLALSKESADNNRSDAISRLALKLIYSSYGAETDYADNFTQLGFSLKNYSYFTTVIIKILNTDSPISDIESGRIMMELAPHLTRQKIDYIYGIKNEEYLIIHLFGTDKASQPNLIKLLERFSQTISSSYTHFISIGKAVNSVEKLWRSYNGAIILMYSSFFCHYNMVLYTDEENTAYSPSIPAELLSEFSDALLTRSETKAQKLLQKLEASLVNNKTMLVNQAKDLYYKLFLELTDAANSFHISISADTTETILDYISKSSTFFELHSILKEKTERFFKSFEDESRDNSAVFLIKEYIGSHYQNESLSIKDISEHVFLSSSYVCTIFKTETGKTLNQYLTEYRIEKAKKLLMDSRYKITDISAKVGYSDGNYFGKTFKKLAGLSPSEFREQYFEGKI